MLFWPSDKFLSSLKTAALVNNRFSSFFKNLVTISNTCKREKIKLYNLGYHKTLNNPNSSNIEQI